MILLDTDVLIDLVTKDEETVVLLERLWEQGETLGTTSLNIAEILRGANRDHATLQATLGILAGLAEVPFGPGAAKRFGQFMHQLDRAGASVPVVDGMIAAVALEQGGRLVTRNRRGFERLAGLEVLVPGASE